MLYVTCDYCGHDAAELVNQGPDLLLDCWDHEYRLVRCRRCTLIYQNPRLAPDELAPHYPESYMHFRVEGQDGSGVLGRVDEYFGLGRRCRQITRRRPRPGTLLDVGCASGVFMAAMRTRGWKVLGVDISPYAVDRARRHFGLEVRHSTLEAAALPSSAFDVVTLWGVLEHVARPKATLAEVMRVVRPGGLVALALPNPTCLEARLFGAAWVGWDRPRHLHVFTPAVIGNYLRQAGLRLERIDSFSGRLGITLLNIEFWCRARRWPEQRWRPMLRWLYNWPMRALTWPAYQLADLCRQTTNMAVFALKDG